MSEYQYYEFRVVDEPLTERQMAALRRLSTRAEITPASFTNEYHWGDFRGNPRQMMEKYFDAFVYYANWGSHWFMLRIPSAGVDVAAMKAYSAENALAIRMKGKHVILDFRSEDEEGGDWEDEGGGRWMTGLLPLRADLLAGDLRALYLGWLAGVQAGDVDEEAIEPPVPPGLNKLSGPLRRFAGFLRIDAALLAAAAAGSEGAPPNRPSHEDVAKWIRGLPVREKDAILLRLAKGHAEHVRRQLLQDARQDWAAGRRPKAGPAQGNRRTVADLQAAREQRARRKHSSAQGRDAQ